MKALLFINGTPPENFPHLEQYTLIAASDGAFHYLVKKAFPLGKLDFVSGDFDSAYEKEWVREAAEKIGFQVYETPDQNRTDFEKALEILLEKGTEKVDIYGGSGGEMDHFLGNLTVAYKFKNRLEIRFYDEFSEYYFIPNTFEISGVEGRMISLYPFPFAEGIITKGLNWPLSNENLNQTFRIGTRNFAAEDRISVEFRQGAILIFIGR